MTILDVFIVVLFQIICIRIIEICSNVCPHTLHTSISTYQCHSDAYMHLEYSTII